LVYYCFVLLNSKNMKTINTYSPLKVGYFFLIMLMLSSCSIQNYFQEFETTAIGGTVTEDWIYFEDSYCRYAYNLWSNGGEVEFSVFNKTKEDVVVDLSKCFFVLNGLAMEYYRNESYTVGSVVQVRKGRVGAVANGSVAIGTTKEVSFTDGTSTTRNEKQFLTIPANTRIELSSFQVRSSRYNDCDLKKYPTSRKSTSVSFDQDNSPIIFSNIVTYYIQGDTLRSQHDFFVEKITEKHATVMQGYSDTTKCGEKRLSPIKVFKNPAADKFYIEYIGE
jgi:hypothetical protein